MIKKRINKLRSQFIKYGIDGYVVPKNDEFFSEHSNKDRLKFISNFSGSAGYAIILKNRNYLFVDGRYTIQSKIESGKNFKILDYFKIIKTDVKKKSSFYSIDKSITGESHHKKISRVSSFLKKNKYDYLFITAPENVAWLLNIRGYDSPTSPIPNSNLLLTKEKHIFLVVDKNKTTKLVKEQKLKQNQIIDPRYISYFFDKLRKGTILLDQKTCSLYLEKILKKKFKITKKEDPIYILKSVKNKIEIKNMINTHIIDGVALTKFIYWIKNLKKFNITEVDAQNKLEKIRRMNSKYLYPSFNTIAGSGKNGAIVHYRATKNNTKLLKRNEIFLCDSGGQYKFGTTDVTRTICFENQNKDIKNIFTNVLKGHIAVAKTDLNKKKTVKLIDKDARKFLKKNHLDYNHGTGHGVGFFLNVHEGPQAISKSNSVKIQKGMILSNEPGYYKKDKFGIRIENLVYVKKIGRKLGFENLTLAPIEKELINFNLLTKQERHYLFNYHLKVYSKISPFLSGNEKKWLASFI